MIYLDHHAATPVSAAVAEAMNRARADGGWANASSQHAAGRAARQLFEQARDRVAAALGATPAEVVFTGGGTEACNLGVRGLMSPGGRVLASGLEHPAVAEAASRGEEHFLPFGPSGADAECMAAVGRLEGGDILAAQWVNHETGVILPTWPWAAQAREQGARVFTDATQGIGKLPFAFADAPFDAVAVAGQKLGATAGIGVLLVRRGLDLTPVRDGGGQERGRRAGTPDVPAAVGMAVACEALADRLAQMPRIAAQRDRLEATALALGGVVNGAHHPRVATCASLAFEGWRSELLVAALDLEGVCASAGAACSSGVQEPVRSVAALHPDEPWRAESSVRFSLGIDTTDADIEGALAALRKVLARA